VAFFDHEEQHALTLWIGHRRIENLWPIHRQPGGRCQHNSPPFDIAGPLNRCLTFGVHSTHADSPHIFRAFDPHLCKRLFSLVRLNTKGAKVGHPSRHDNVAFDASMLSRHNLVLFGDEADYAPFHR